MNSVRRCSRARFLTAPVAGLLLVAIPSTFAADGRWVTRDGRKFDLIRSKSELAVELHSCDAMEACAGRVSSSGEGTLESFRHAPDAKIKLLKTKDAGRERRDRIRQDPAIRDVRSIYRFAGHESPLLGTGNIVLKVQRGLDEKGLRGLWTDFGVSTAAPVKGQPNVYKVTVGEDQDELLLAEALADDPRTVWAQPDFRREIVQHQTTPTITPADQYFAQQWHLNNTGQLGGTAGADIDALEAWSTATGAGIVFGMFDDAVDVDHEDLRDNYLGVGHDVTLTETDTGFNDPRPKDFDNRHGTAVMGLAVARANNRGIRGVAFDAKFTASRGLSDLATDSQIASSYIFARDQNVDVHINSWGFGGRFPDPDILADAIEVAFATGRNKGDLDGDGDDDPLGMVVVFASGNNDREQLEGFALDALPQVISIGASNDNDQRSVYSNFGTSLSVLAPSNDGGANAGLFTTDNMDTSEIDKGYNEGGIGNFVEGDFIFFEGFELDETGSYTGLFGGTSGACPIAAGVAGLILSVNPNLTATDVRMLIEHTTDKVDLVNAAYHSITGHSSLYGHGRINAGGAGDTKLGAVEAAQQTLTNGGITWPDRPADVTVDSSTIRWKQNPGTLEFLVVQSDNSFGFIPTDGTCYDSAQSNCGGSSGGLPSGVTVLAVGCGLSCDGAVGECATGAEQCVTLPIGNKSKAIYARNALGRYSFGVAIDSAGNVTGSGRFIDLLAAGEVVIPTGPPASRPEVTISVSPLEGDSPLTVNFTGNAVSSVPIDESRTTWDFDIEAPPEVDTTARSASHVYEVAAGETRTFIARLTMYDTNGTPGAEEVAITVKGSGADDDGLSTGSLRIIVGLPGTPDADVNSGVSPFDVLLSVDATSVPGTLQAVSWDLGDGSRAVSLVVPHTYLNEGTTDLRIPISATVTTTTGQNTTVNTTATRIITVSPGEDDSDSGEAGECELPGTCAQGPGGSAQPCGLGLGMIPMVFMLMSLSWLRRRAR